MVTSFFPVSEVRVPRLVLQADRPMVATMARVAPAVIHRFVLSFMTTPNQRLIRDSEGVWSHQMVSII